MDSHSANCFKSASSLVRTSSLTLQRLERGSTENLAALNSVAGLTGSGRRFPGAFGDGANPGSKITAVPQRIHLDAEYRARGERGPP